MAHLVASGSISALPQTIRLPKFMKKCETVERSLLKRIQWNMFTFRTISMIPNNSGNVNGLLENIVDAGTTRLLLIITKPIFRNVIFRTTDELMRYRINE